METIYCKCDICNLFNSFKIGLKDENKTKWQKLLGQLGKNKNENAEFLLEQFMEIVLSHHEEANAKTIINGKV